MITGWKNLRTAPPVALMDPAGARRAVRESRQRLIEEQQRSCHIDAIATNLKERQEKNHFAELLTMAMGPKRREEPC